VTRECDSAPKRLTFGKWWNGLPPETREVLRPHRDRLVRAFRKPRKDDLRWWYEVGQSVQELFPRNDRRHGKGFMELLADMIEPGRDSTKKSLITYLYRFREFAQKCDRREVADLAAKVRNGLITTCHVTFLLTVTDKNTKTRGEFLAECLKHGWSANELKRQVQNDRIGLTSHGGRRSKARTASNPAVAARDLVVRTRGWKACHQAYFKARSAPLRKLPKVVNKALLRQIEEASTSLDEIAKLVAEAQGILGPLVEKLRAKLPSKKTR
jgi:hypothetical protein